MSTVARFFIVLGLVFVFVGLLFLFFPKIHLLRLPGDIVIKRENFVFVFPITTSIALSIIITVILNLIARR